jgi:multicomponent Na+:H+ antiporter subunit E
MEEGARFTNGHSPLGYPKQDQGKGWRFVLQVGARAAIFALFWWVMSNGNPESWILGGPVVLLATGSSLLLSHGARQHWRLTGLLSFVPFFLWRSFCGSIDVARRAMHPKMPLEPTFIDYNLSLPNGAPRLFMANVVSLLPGTLSAELRGDCLKVHVLDANAEVPEELQRLEAKVGHVFGLEPLGRVISEE